MIRAEDLRLSGRIMAAPGALAAHIAGVYAGYDMGTALPEGGLRVEFSMGVLDFLPAEGALTVAITALSPADLFVLREAVESLIEGFDTALLERTVWDRPAPRLAHPPNFRLGRVLAVSRPGQGFIRLRIGAEDLAPYAVTGLHLRLLLPPEGRAAVWPSVSDQGRTIWPKGEDALHNPVYTIRAIDPAAGWLEVDIYLHGRGRTCHWAQAVQVGAEVGLIGPGGGFIPTERHLVMLGDETALPAMARILETLGPEVQGQALILVAGPQAMQAVACPEGITLRWLFRSAGDSLEGALAGLGLPAADAPGGRHLWISGEKAAIQRLRPLYGPATGWQRGETTISSYWTDEATPG
jgi:NADPH-dependent ferric siderophore reductase